MDNLSYQENRIRIGKYIREVIDKKDEGLQKISIRGGIIGLNSREAILYYIRNICSGNFYGASKRIDESEKGVFKLIRLSQLLSLLELDKDNQIIDEIKSIDERFVYPPYQGEIEKTREIEKRKKLIRNIGRKMKDFDENKLRKVSNLVDKLSSED